MPWLATVKTHARLTVLLTLMVELPPMACWSLMLKLLLLRSNNGLWPDWNGPDPFPLMHGLDPLKT
ncbi:hypothetical protein, partial [Streptomyces plicatus]|uniref:hypothetical protein n=1 Tax=Streptomyces plicatus TaxID=1922 RepID=UPI001FE35836